MGTRSTPALIIFAAAMLTMLMLPAVALAAGDAPDGLEGLDCPEGSVPVLIEKAVPHVLDQEGDGQVIIDYQCVPVEQETLTQDTQVTQETQTAQSDAYAVAGSVATVSASMPHTGPTLLVPLLGAGVFGAGALIVRKRGR